MFRLIAVCSVASHLRAHVTICFFFFNDTATTEIYTLSLHDALPIWLPSRARTPGACCGSWASSSKASIRSEEHTSELQSQSNLVCRLLLEKKKKEMPRLMWYDVFFFITIS